MDDARLAALLTLLDSHVAALALADATEALQSVDIAAAPGRQGERVTASEIRNRVRRQIEERRM